MRKTTIRRGSLLAAGATAGLAVPVVFATPAQAHETRIFTGIGEDRGVVAENDQRVYACNTQPDGHAVVVYYRTQLGIEGNVRDGTVNGECPYADLFFANDFITEYKACTQDVVCTGWVRQH